MTPQSFNSSAGQASPSNASASTRSSSAGDDEAILLAEDIEERQGLTADDFAALLAVEAVKGFGPQKFRELHESGLMARDVIDSPSQLPVRGARGDTFRKALETITSEQMRTHRQRAVRQLVRAHQNNAAILTYRSACYPRNVWDSNNPIPILYVKGDPGVLAEAWAVACVGSRDTKGRYAERHEQFAAYAAGQGYTVVSGFALGADTIGHKAAWHAGGRTVCVMPCGLDRPFPPENRWLWSELTRYRGATMVSEFPFGTAASGLTLRKRNKLIVAAALGVLISQSSAKGGAMNAYRFAIEQKKPVATFAGDGSEATSGNRMIAHGPPDGRVFAADRAEKESWAEWLRWLSSSI